MRPWSMAAQKVGFRTRPCCPGTTSNRRQPLLRRIACAAQPSFTSVWVDRRCERLVNDEGVVTRFQNALEELPT